MKYNGYYEDPRSELEKLKDYSHEELIGTGGYVWKDFVLSDIPEYTIRNQDGSSACGAFAGAKMLGALYKKTHGKYVDLLPQFIYKKRENYPSEGMYLTDIFKIASKYGSPLDEKLLGDNLNETQCNSFPITEKMSQEALEYAGGTYLYIDVNNIDEVAKVIDQGYTPIILVKCNIAEWTGVPKVIQGTTNFNIVHFVPCIYAGMRGGVKTIVINDSWGSSYGLAGLRYITEDFWKNRVLQVMYMREKIPMAPKPRYNFTKMLSYGLTGNDDVRALQNILKYEGCLDTSVQSTGNYYNLTAQAVMKLQLKNNIASPAEIYSLAGKKVGPKTLAYLQKNYAIS